MTSSWPNAASGVRRNIYSEFTDAMVNDTFDTQVFAVYGSMNYDITEAFELSVALRYDSEKRDVTNGVPPRPMAHSRTTLTIAAASARSTVSH